MYCVSTRAWWQPRAIIHMSKRSKKDKDKDKDKRSKHKKEKKEKKRAKKEAKQRSGKTKKRKRDESRSQSRSRSSSGSSSSSSSGLPAVPQAPQALSNASMCVDLYPMPRRRLSAGPIISGPPASAGELQRRGERAQRFEATAADQALAAHRASAAPAAPPPAGTVLTGASQMLEKSYMRLTTLPNAADVRPLPVLRQAFELVVRKWRAERDYTYACDMLKAIRQDLTVQHLGAAGAAGVAADDGGHAAAAFAVCVYETHARIALDAGDLGEFGACQAQLTALHARQPSVHAAEFVAYRLLHAATTPGVALAAELHPILGSLSPEAATDLAVSQALRIAVALDGGDTMRALAEVPAMAHSGASLLRPRLDALRERALHALCRAYAPTLPLNVLSRRLGFGDCLHECERWLRSLGTVPAAAEGRPERELCTKQALRTLAHRAEVQRAEEAAELSRDRERAHAVGPPLPIDRIGGWDW